MKLSTGHRLVKWRKYAKHSSEDTISMRKVKMAIRRFTLRLKMVILMCFGSYYNAEQIQMLK